MKVNIGEGPSVLGGRGQLPDGILESPESFVCQPALVIEFGGSFPGAKLRLEGVQRCKRSPRT